MFERPGISVKILFITYYFQPEPNFFVGLPFAKELVRRGHYVQVLTGFPNYPGGKIFDGYKIKPLMREEMEGIPVIRVPLYPSHDQSASKRIITYSSWALSAGAIGPLAVSKADVAYVSQGPATIGWPAMILKWLRGIPFVFDIKDLWPDSLSATAMFTNTLGMAMVGKWCKFVYDRAGFVTCCTPGIKRKVVERGVPEGKVEVIYNWCDDSLICREEPNHELAKKLGMDGKFNIVFAGNIGKAQAMGAVLDAAKLLASDCPQVQFVLIGWGVEVEPLKQKAKNSGLSNVLFLARRPISEIGPILRLADVLLVHLRDDPLFRITIPSKTQAYLAMGRPVLMGVKGDAAALVEKADAGLSCEPENPGSIADAVKKFCAMTRSQHDTMGSNGMIFYDRELSFQVAVEKYEKVFKCVAKSH
jgi:glycosyltransferase involved in cell wall biosynthesis